MELGNVLLLKYNFWNLWMKSANFVFLNPFDNFTVWFP